MSFGNFGGKVSRPDCSTVRSRKWRGIPASWESEWDCTRATMLPNGYMLDVATYRMVEVLRTGIVTCTRALMSCLTMNLSCISRNNYARSDADLPNYWR